MKPVKQRSREIIEILADVVRKTSDGCEIVVMGGKRETQTIPCPAINYTFGNARYVKDRLDELSKTPKGCEMKFPLIALFCPFNEQRNSPDYYTKAKVRILIAYSSMQQWSNEQRLETSFKNVLRPIYLKFIDALMEDQRNVMIGIKNDEIVYVPFSKAIKNDKPINRELLSTLRRLSI